MISQRLYSRRGTALVNGELIDPEELYSATAFTNAISRSRRGTALVNGYRLVRGTALVNNIDSLGNIVNTSPLVNSGTLVNSSGLLNSSTISLNSNTETIVIMGDHDVAILTGDSVGNVEIRSVSLVTGRTVGTHLSVPGTFLTNNFNVTYGLGNIIILPDTAEIIFNLSSLEQTYDGTPKSVTVSTVPDSLPVSITYNGDTIVPVNAGTYTVQVSLLDSNYVTIGSTSATLEILPDTAEIVVVLADLDQTYDGTPRSVSATTFPAGLDLSITYDADTILPVNAGTYAVQVVINDSNYIGIYDATLVIAQVPATVATGIYVINEGDALPTFTVVFDGFINGDDETVVTSLSFTVDPNYSGNEGIYDIIASATATNYAFTSINGTLYVNPSGPGTKQVKPNFVCYEELSSPDADGFLFLAYYEYDNRNQDAIYIPIGLKNEIYGTAHNNVNQPELFLPGGGDFIVPFDGDLGIVWQVTSNKKNGTTGSIPANASNNPCSAAGAQGFDPGTSIKEDKPTALVYPNPSTGKVFLQFSEERLSDSKVEVYNYLGMRCNISADRTSDQLFEIDLSGHSKGLYLIQIISKDGIEAYNVFIE